MNIFVTSTSPVQCARDIPDRLLPKMILETAQLLSTAHHVLDDLDQDNPLPGDQDLYRKTHANHPCGVWVRASADNYQWTYLYLLALGVEFHRRRDKTHLTIRKLRHRLARAPYNVPTAPLSPPPACMPDEYKVPSEAAQWPVRSYQDYLTRGKAYITGPEAWGWTGEVPSWYQKPESV
jgi:hypothetical protein